MKKRITRKIGVIFILMIGIINNLSAQGFGGGEGTEENPYVISTAEHLFNVRTSPNSFYKLQNDIDLESYQEGEGWLPISAFGGCLDGQGFKVKNLKINRPAANYQGLFAQILSPGGKVENLNVEGTVVGGDMHVGGIAGACFGTIARCSFSGQVEGSNQHVGGIAGMMALSVSGSPTISYCYNTATVKGKTRVGGITGFSTQANVANCFNTGKVTSDGISTGGIVGFNDNARISNCYNTGKIDSGGDAGGIAGFSNPSTATIDKCYNTGDIYAPAGNVGGIIGKNAESIVSNCAVVCLQIRGASSFVNRIAGASLGSTSCYQNNYALSTMKVGGNTVSDNDANSVNGADKTLAELRTKATYETGLGWDFSGVWAFVTGCYPQLKETAPVPEHLFAGGTGTETDPYTISEAVHLYNIRKSPDSYFKLLNDIDLTEYQEGEGWEPVVRFCGWLDGAGYEVRNLKINRPKTDNQGLIGITTNSYSGLDPEIKNLTVIGEIIGQKNVGGLIGGNNDANITRCSFSGTVEGKENVGGLIGSTYCNSATPEENRIRITECFNHGLVTTAGTGGGLVGLGSYVVISKCYNAANIKAQAGYIGGIVGYAVGWKNGQGPNAESGGCLVTDCYNTGNIDGGYKVGGIAGNVTTTTLITKSYNSGVITNTGDPSLTGGIAGAVDDAQLTSCVAAGKELTGATAFRIAGGKTGTCTIENNYALANMKVNGAEVAESDAASLNGLAKTAAELNTQAPYQFLNWDFENTWVSVNGFLPVLNGISEIPVQRFAGGDGTMENPYIIITAAHLNNIRNYLTSHFILEDDIDLSGYSEGEGWNPMAPFSGTLNGKGHTITQLTINRPSANYQALFAYMTGAVIDSLTLEDASVTGNERIALVAGQAVNCQLRNIVVSGKSEGSQHVAGLVGYAEGTSFDNCRNEAAVTGKAYCAGLASYNNGNITNCLNTGTITSTAPDYAVHRYVGGIVAMTNDCVIKDTRNEGKIVSSTRYVGGICGMNAHGLMENCSNTAAVTGRMSLAGICGINDGGQIVQCYNTGSVTGEVDLGGVAGRNWQATMSYCYNTGEIQGTTVNVGTDGAVGGVVGVNDQSVLTLSYNEGNVIGYDFVGGVAGVNTGDLNKSYNRGYIKGTGYYTGGVVGSNTGDPATSSMKLCYNTGEVENTFVHAGGVAGRNSSHISDCYNTGLVSGATGNGGIAGQSQTTSGADVTIQYCLNRGDVTGTEGYHGGIIGENGYSGQVMHNVAANASVDGTEAYRIVGTENANMANIIADNYAWETMLVNGSTISCTDPNTYDGKDVTLASLLSKDLYVTMGWDFENNWFISDGVSFPSLAWQPRLSTEVTGKLEVYASDSRTLTVALEKNGFEVDPLNDISWNYEACEGLEITSADNREFTITGDVIGATTTLVVALDRGNTLSIPVEIVNGVGIRENGTTEGIAVYPSSIRPGERITVDTRSPGELLHRIELFDLSSRKVSAVSPENTERMEFTVGNIAAGTYILRVVTKSGQSVSNYIVVR